jgi:hypothetical protein
VQGGIISQAHRYFGGVCSSQSIFPPHIIQVLLVRYGAVGIAATLADAVWTTLTAVYHAMPGVGHSAV